MSTVDLITAATSSLIRPEWCQKEKLGDYVIGVLYEPGRGELDLKAAAQRLDETAAARGWVIGEVARVRKQQFEAIYARPTQVVEVPPASDNPAETAA